MNKQVEKIKKELERRIREDYNGNEYQDEIAQGACASILYYINSLEEESVSEDLEKAAVEAFKHIVDSDKNNFYEIFKAGANWQKEKMMKDAVDAEVGYWNIRGLSLNVRLKGDIEDGDRVKLIMIKEE